VIGIQVRVVAPGGPGDRLAGSGAIRAGSDGRVCLTQGAYSPGETQWALFAGSPAYAGKGTSVVGVNVPDGVEVLRGTQANEVIVFGSLRPTIVCAGPNPF
jgi:hypothetical protein